MDSQEKKDFSRRDFMRSAAVGAAGLATVGFLGACSSDNSNDNGSQEGQSPSASAESNAEFSMSGFSDWALEGGNSGASGAAFFLEGEENKPSDTDLDKMLQTANTYFQCHGLTGTHFIVIKDTEEQAEILRFMGGDGTGTVTVLVMADGVKAQEYHQEQYFPGPSDVNGGNPEYWNMHYGIFEAGWATGYLNLAARELGYRTRVFGALNIPNAMTGEVDPYGTGGNFEYITTENWEIEKYMQPKDGGDKFDHYCMALERDLGCEGNVTLLCAVTIGKIDEVDVVTSATVEADYKKNIRYNYDIWG